MTVTTIRKPTELDFSDERLEIGDRANAVTKMSQFQDEMDEFGRQLNDETIPDIQAVGNAAIAARDAATQSATSAAQSSTTAQQAAQTAANDAVSQASSAIESDVQTAQQAAIDAQNAAQTAATNAASAFNATVVNDAMADVADIPSDGQLLKNRRYYLPAGSSVTMPTDCDDDDWLELIPVGDLASTAANVTFGHPVQDSSGQSLAAGTHQYNACSIRKFVFKNGWL